MRTRLLAGTALVTALAVLFLPLPDAVRVAVKALPCLCMTWIAWEGAGPRSLRAGVALALLFSVVGDVVLEVPDRPDLFVPGLLAFLVAHVIYVVAFWNEERALRPLLLVPVLLWTGAMWMLLRPYLGDLLVPVTVYIGVITTMIWRAVARAPSGGQAGAWSLVGGVLFGVSDSLLATNKFVGALPAADLLILGTYWLGQAGLTASAVLPRSAPGPR